MPACASNEIYKCGFKAFFTRKRLIVNYKQLEIALKKSSFIRTL